MKIRSILLTGSAFAFGVVCGFSKAPLQSTANAQGGGALEAPLSEDAANQVRAVGRSISAAKDALEAEGRYKAATEIANPFLVLSGGGDALADLESDNGVDPETFAALYAGLASEEIQDDVSIDDEGHVRYKGKVIRMYSIKRLKELYALRAELAKSAN